MELMAPATVYALNGSSIRLSCTFNSCYQVDKKQFSLNWTYQTCQNCTEEMVSIWTGGLDNLCAPRLNAACASWPINCVRRRGASEQNLASSQTLFPHSPQQELCALQHWVGGGMDHELGDPCPSFLSSLPVLPPTLPTTARNSREWARLECGVLPKTLQFF